MREEEPEFRRRIVKSASAAAAIVRTVDHQCRHQRLGETFCEVVYLQFLEVLSLLPRTRGRKEDLLFHEAVVAILDVRLLASDIVGLASSK